MNFANNFAVAICLIAAIGVEGEAAAGILRQADLVFDYFEVDSPQDFPPSVMSVETDLGYVRNYDNGNRLLAQDGDLYYWKGGSWTRDSTIQAWWNLIRNVMTKDEVRLDGVPFQSQLSADCSPNNLCGYAATNMLTSYFHGVSPTTEFMQDMAEAEKGSRCPASFSDMDDYLSAARNTGNAPDSYKGFLSYDTIKMILSRGIPVHLGVTYGKLGEYRCSTFAGGHELVVVGYSQPNGTWTVHDPLCKSGFRTIPSEYFRAAVTDAHGDDSGAWTLVVW